MAMKRKLQLCVSIPIGRLKTELDDETVDSTTVFQFLIGRLKTISESRKPLPDLMFQFLIGRLKTEIYAFVAEAKGSFNSL